MAKIDDLRASQARWRIIIHYLEDAKGNIENAWKLFEGGLIHAESAYESLEEEIADAEDSIHRLELQIQKIEFDELNPTFKEV